MHITLSAYRNYLLKFILSTLFFLQRMMNKHAFFSQYWCSMNKCINLQTEGVRTRNNQIKIHCFTEILREKKKFLMKNRNTGIEDTWRRKRKLKTVLWFTYTVIKACPKHHEGFQSFYRGFQHVLREVHGLFSKLCAPENSKRSQNQLLAHI